jgi:hypothetical protein
LIQARSASDPAAAKSGLPGRCSRQVSARAARLVRGWHRLRAAPCILVHAPRGQASQQAPDRPGRRRSGSSSERMRAGGLARLVLLPAARIAADLLFSLQPRGSIRHRRPARSRYGSGRRNLVYLRQHGSFFRYQGCNHDQGPHRKQVSRDYRSESLRCEFAPGLDKRFSIRAIGACAR